MRYGSSVLSTRTAGVGRRKPNAVCLGCENKEGFETVGPESAPQVERGIHAESGEEAGMSRIGEGDGKVGK